MNITEVARASGLTPKTIRYYEEIGLVTPQRGHNGYRQFSPEEVRRLTFLGRARQLDFPLQDCRELLMLNADTERSSADVREIACVILPRWTNEWLTWRNCARPCRVSSTAVLAMASRTARFSMR